jgi:hypothetical protein
MRALLPLLLAAVSLAGQEVRVYSEFQRPDPFGGIAVPDRGAPAREILSPALARNAWASFWVACTLREGESAYLYIQQNPELLEVDLYRASFVKTARGWVPDGLEKVEPPSLIRLPEAEKGIPGQNTAVFLVDIRVPPLTQPNRIRFQADMRIGEDWVSYPMELRVMRATVPGAHSGAGVLPHPGVRADAALVSVLRSRLCGAPEPASSTPGLNARRLLRRNAQQDAALVADRAADLLKHAGLDGAALCQGARPTPPDWWVSLRTRLFRWEMAGGGE